MSRIAGMNAAAAINKKLSTEEGLQEFAKIQADELGLQNQAKIELAREDLSQRATGTTNYGQDVEAPVQSYIDRNASQADVARRESLARQQGETAKGHLDRLALDPNAALNRTAMEEKTFRETRKFADRERAIREYLSRGAQNVKDPNLQRLASEFVAEYPDEYRRIKAEMRGEQPVAPMQTPEERQAALAGAADRMTDIEARRLGGEMGRELTGEERGYLSMLNSGEFRNMSESEKMAVMKRVSLEGADNDFTNYLLDKMEKQSAGSLPGQQVSRSRSQQALYRFQSLGDDEKKMYMDAAYRELGVTPGGPDAEYIGPQAEDVAARLYDEQLRKKRGLDPESRRARQDEVARSRAISAITSRYGNNPAMLQRAMDNWNSRNLENPLTRDDFGLPAAGQNVTARPGEVVEVDNVRSVNPSKVAAGSILTDATGSYRTARRKDGSSYGQRVLQDQTSGFYFPEPDTFDTSEKFNGAMTRQDRVNMRQAILNSGNSVLANEQRRLDAARQAAASSIPEIRDAGIKEVAELEADLHWRYISEAAALAGPRPTGAPDEIELGRPTSSTRTSTKEPTRADAVEAFRDYLDDAPREEKTRLQGMSPQEQEAFGFDLLQPYAKSGGAAPRQPAAGAGRGPAANRPSIAANSTPDDVRSTIQQSGGDILREIMGKYQEVLPNPTEADIIAKGKEIREDLRSRGLYSSQVARAIEDAELKMIRAFEYSAYATDQGTN